MLWPRRQHLESKAACSVTRPLRGRGRPCPRAQFQAFNHSTGCLATKQFPRRWRNLNVFPSLLVWQSWAAGWNTSTPWLFPLVHRRPQCRRGAQPSSPVLQWSQSGRQSTKGHLKRLSSIPCFTAQSGASTQLGSPSGVAKSQWLEPSSADLQGTNEQKLAGEQRRRDSSQASCQGMPAHHANQPLFHMPALTRHACKHASRLPFRCLGCRKKREATEVKNSLAHN